MKKLKVKKISILMLIPVLAIGISLYGFADAAPSKIGITPPEKFNGAENSEKIPQGLFTRVIADTVSPKDISDFTKKGCKVVHNLKASTALKCPTDIVPSLQNVREDKVYYPLDLVEANWPMQAEKVYEPIIYGGLGIDGTEVKVAVLDTGVDETHQELFSSIKLKDNFTTDTPDDTHGHGTHVVGSVTGTGLAVITGHPYPYVQPNWATGSAPGADVIVGKVCGQQYCFESDIIQGINWAVAEGADVISMSLGSNDVYDIGCTDSVVSKVNDAVDSGVVVIIASGNGGNSDGISSPACAEKAISVGATEADGTGENEVASFSNSVEGLTLVAPGVGILSTQSCHAAGDCNSNSYWYTWKSGTSMATPAAAGVAALLLDANPDLTPAEVKTALCVGAIPSTKSSGTPESRDGCGMINALAAVNSVLTPTDEDGDGYTSGVDCDDTDAGINPGATEVAYDGIDQDCSGADLTDVDVDGYDSTIVGGTDCNDSVAGINPGATDIPDNGIDEDCDGSDATSGNSSVISVSDLTGSVSGKKWKDYSVTIMVAYDANSDGDNITVDGRWSDGTESTCNTESGVCTIVLSFKADTMIFTVTDLSGQNMFYDASQNTETEITLSEDDGGTDGGNGGGPPPGKGKNK